MLRTALGGEGKHRNARIDAAEHPSGFGGSDCDGSELFRRGNNVHRAVRKNHHAIVAIGLIGEFHNEAARHGVHAGSHFDDLQARAQRCCRGADRAGDHAVHLVVIKHHRAKEHGVLHGGFGLFGGHALGLAHFIKLIRIASEIGRGSGIHNINAREAHAERFRLCLDGFRVAQKRKLGNAFFGDNLRRADGAFFLALGQHDMFHVGFGFHFDLVENGHFGMISFRNSCVR